MSRPASHAGSATSNRSNASTKSKYKTVAKASFVDDTLFGSPKKTPQSETMSPTAKNSPSVKLMKTTSMRQRTENGEDLLVLTAKDLERMKKPSPIISAEEAQRMKDTATARREEKQAASVARKEKMLKMEEDRKKSIPPTETERLKMEADSQLLTRAQMAKLEEADDVKHMNQMMLYAKCVTIRDAQIEEKKHMMLEEEEEERKLDLMMEIERLKALEHYEERERLRHLERVAGAGKLQLQIDDRKAQKLREDELQAQERAQMSAEIKRLEAEERVARERKIEQAKLLMAEVAESNSEQIRRKKEVQQREAIEEAQIARYLTEKAAKDAEEARKAAALHKAKEEEIAKLRAKQEKAQDKQSELDELRARRYQEAYEREWRAKEAAAAERQKRTNAELVEARDAQQQARLKQMADQAMAEKEEFLRILAANRAKEEEEAQQASAQRTIRNRHREELMNQIKANREAKAREDQAALEDGRKALEKFSQHQAQMLKMKELKLGELKGSGVPDKYCSELQTKKLSK